MDRVEEFMYLLSEFDLSSTQAAKMIGVSPSTINAYRAGRLDVPLERLLRLRQIVSAIKKAQVDQDNIFYITRDYAWVEDGRCFYQVREVDINVTTAASMTKIFRTLSSAMRFVRTQYTSHEDRTLECYAIHTSPELSIKFSLIEHPSEIIPCLAHGKELSIFLESIPFDSADDKIEPDMHIRGLDY